MCRVSGVVERANAWPNGEADGDAGRVRGLGGRWGEGESGDDYDRGGGESEGARGAHRSLVKGKGDGERAPVLFPLRVVAVLLQPCFSAGVEHDEAVIKGEGSAACMVKAFVDEVCEVLVGEARAEGERAGDLVACGVRRGGGVCKGSGEEDSGDAPSDRGGDRGRDGDGEANVASRVEEAGTSFSDGGGGGSEPRGFLRGIAGIGGKQ